MKVQGMHDPVLNMASNNFLALALDPEIQVRPSEPSESICSMLVVLVISSPCPARDCSLFMYMWGRNSDDERWWRPESAAQFGSMTWPPTTCCHGKDAVCGIDPAW